jgi:hypothetical protein
MSEHKQSHQDEALVDGAPYNDVNQNPLHSDATGHENASHSVAKSPNVGTADPTDGKDRYQWESLYPQGAQKIIHREATYLVCVFIVALLFILASWKGTPGDILNVTGQSALTLRKYCYYVGAGSLGGAVFGIKYLYRVVARGYWHMDRQMWRYLSPLVSLGVAFAIGALIEASMFSGHAPRSSAAVVGTGFLIGYFADQAIAKMFEVATVLFGSTGKSSEGKSEK